MAAFTEVANEATAQKHLFLSITIAGDESDSFAGHVSSVLVGGSPSSVSWSGGAPGSKRTDTIEGDNTIAINVVQDVENGDSLLNFLIRHRGEAATFKYRPKAEGTFEVSVDVPSIVAPQIGGAVNAFNESSVSMGCSEPSYTQPAASA